MKLAKKQHNVHLLHPKAAKQRRAKSSMIRQGESSEAHCKENVFEGTEKIFFVYLWEKYL